MTSLESIEKLRESLNACTKKAGVDPFQFDTYWITARACDVLIDEIEREIAEKYIELPVDADGVPIHVGDEMENGEYRGKVTDMSWDGHFWHVYHGSIAIAPCDYTHIKPDKLKERVRKFIHDRRGLNLKDPQEKADRMLDEFCADIREMAKEGEL